MKKNVLWVIIAVLCIALFVCAYLLYGELKDEYAPDNLAPVQTESTTTEPPASEAAPSEAETTAPAVQTAPDFTAEDTDGNSVRLSDYFGTPIVLNLWASWCPPCKAEMPHFEAAYLENPDIQFLMVNMTTGDNMEDAKALLASEGYTFPVLFDVTSEAAIAYQATSLPMTLFIGADGAIVTYAVGALSAESLNTGIDLIRK